MEWNEKIEKNWNSCRMKELNCISINNSTGCKVVELQYNYRFGFRVVVIYHALPNQQRFYLDGPLAPQIYHRIPFYNLKMWRGILWKISVLVSLRLVYFEIAHEKFVSTFLTLMQLQMFMIIPANSWFIFTIFLYAKLSSKSFFIV